MNKKTCIGLGAIIGLAIILVLGTQVGQSEGELFRRIIDKHNYGFVLQEKRQIYVSVATGKVIFYYQLPEQELNLTMIDIDCSRLRAMRRRNIPVSVCTSNQSLIAGAHFMRLESLKYLVAQMRHVYEVVGEIPGRLRLDKRGVWAEGWSWFTGLATEDEVSNVQEILDKVETGIERAANVWKSGTSHFLAAIKVEKTRVDNLYSLIEMQRSTFREFNKKLLDIYHEEDTRMSILGHMLNTVRSMVFQISEIDHLYNAVQSLLNGRLPHFLITHKQLTRALTELQKYLEDNHPDLVLVKNDTAYYYQHGAFHVFRYNRHLVINLQVPLTFRRLTNQLSVFKIQLVPLAAPKVEDKHYTTLNVNFQAVAYNPDSDYYVIIDSLVDLPTSEILNLQTSNLILRSRAFKTCALALMEGNLQEIKDLCQYLIINSELPQDVIKLNHNTVLISNIGSVTIECINSSQAESFELSEMQTVFSLKCGCVATVGDFYLVETNMQCDRAENSNVTIEPRYILNLPYISEFLREDWLHQIQADSYFNFSLPTDFPQLKMASKQYDEIIAADKISSFEMSKIINKTLDDETAFSDLSEYLFNVLIKTHKHDRSFDFLNAWDWLMIIASVVAFAAMILAITLHFKLKTVYVMLLATQRARADLILPTRVMYRAADTTTSPTENKIDFAAYVSTLQEIVPVDVSILLCFIFAIIMVILYFYLKFKRARNYRTALILEIGNQKTKMLISVGYLSYSPEFYRFIVAQDAVEITLHEYYFSSAVEWFRGIEIKNTLLNMKVQLQTDVRINLWQARPLRAILTNHYYAVLQVVGLKDDLKEVILLKPFYAELEEAGRKSLYPVEKLQQMH